jgi:hypothetical protein
MSFVLFLFSYKSLAIVMSGMATIIMQQKDLSAIITMVVTASRSFGKTSAPTGVLEKWA